MQHVEHVGQSSLPPLGLTGFVETVMACIVMACVVLYLVLWTLLNEKSVVVNTSIGFSTNRAYV